MNTFVQSVLLTARKIHNCLKDAMKMHQSPPRYEYKHILLWNNCSRPLTDPQTWAKKNQRAFTCCSRCSWKDWGPPVNGWSDCPPGSPCCSCYWPPRRWWLLHLCVCESHIHESDSQGNLQQVEQARARRQKPKLPLKHWIHFRRSSLWPPTSNILSDDNTKYYRQWVKRWYDRQQ